MDSSTDKQQRQSKKKIVFLVLRKNKTNKTNHLSERSIIYRPFWKNQKIKTNRKEHTVCYNIAKTEDTCREKPSKAQNVSYLT